MLHQYGCKRKEKHGIFVACHLNVWEIPPGSKKMIWKTRLWPILLLGVVLFTPQFKQKTPKMTFHGNWNYSSASASKTGTHVIKVSWQIKGIPIFLWKGLMWFKVLLKHWKGFKLWVKLLFLDNNKIFFLFKKKKKYLVIQTYTRSMYLDLLSISICKITQL